MKYWLLKSEPGEWSWEDQVESGEDTWDGVRNYQACNNMKSMKIGDLAFFYHSVNEKRIVGIVKIVKEAYPDDTDETGRFCMVNVEPVCPVKKPVTLAEIKQNPDLQNLALVRQSRLSVVPVGDEEWKIICQMAETEV